MTTLRLSALLCATALLSASAQAQRIRPAAPSPLAWADPLVGSDPFEARDLMGGNPAPGEELYAPSVVVGPRVPDGVPVSPNTGFDGVYFVRGAGYRHSDLSIMGFSHLNFQYGQFGYAQLMPTLGRVQTVPGARDGSEAGYRSPFRAETEHAWPGYYGVRLDRTGITAELTATERTALHRYTFPASDSANVLLDLGNLGLRPPHRRDYDDLQREGDPDSLYVYYAHTWGKELEAHLTIVNDSTAEGWERTSRDTVYVTARFSRPFDSASTWSGRDVRAGRRAVRGDSVGAAFHYRTHVGEALLVRVGVSRQSAADARQAVDEQAGRWDFDADASAAEAQWTDLLNLVEVEGGSDADRANFYSALYRTLENDATLTWPIGGADDLLLRPDRLRARLRRDPWRPSGGGFWGPGRQPEVAGAALAGLADGPDGFDAERAYQAIKRSATDPSVGWENLGAYLPRGYITSEEPMNQPPQDSPGDRDAVSRTLGFAYADFAVAQLAERLGHADDAAFFLQRSQNYRTLFDPSVGFFVPRRADGSFAADFDPTRPYAAQFYREGTAWHYLWLVPHDTQGLINLLGSDAAFVAKLDEFFETPYHTSTPLRDVTGMLGQYTHGNETDRHAPYLYTYAGAAWKTQQRVAQIRSLFYRPTPGGLSGNEDLGMMSNWYLFSALGLYPIQPEIGVYAIGTPLFPRATVHLAETLYGGGDLVVEAPGVSAENVYIQSATLNGQPLGRAWIRQSDLVGGARLVFEMGPAPNPVWGASEPPPSMTPARR